MKKVPVVILFVTVFAGFYQLSPFIGVPMWAIASMFILSPFLVIYMAWVILKFGKPPGHAFDERFYDDVEV